MGALRRKMTRAGLPGLLATALPDLRYLSGFTGSSAALAVTRRAARLFTDGRYTEQAAEEVAAAEVQIVSGSPAIAAVGMACGMAGRGLRRIRPGSHDGRGTVPLAGGFALPIEDATFSLPCRCRWWNRCAGSKTETNWP